MRSTQTQKLESKDVSTSRPNMKPAQGITAETLQKVIETRWCTCEHELDLTFYPYSCLKTDRKAVQIISINHCICALKKSVLLMSNAWGTAVLVRTTQRLPSWWSLGQTSMQTGSPSSCRSTAAGWQARVKPCVLCDDGKTSTRGCWRSANQF